MSGANRFRSAIVPAWVGVALALVIAWIPGALAADTSPTRAPAVLDDVNLWKRFADELGEQHGKGRTPSLVELREQLNSRTTTPIQLASARRRNLEPEEIYRRCAESVVAIGSVYKCDRCPHWHTGGTATGWVIGETGEIVSNHHVFAESRNTNVVAIGAMTRDGRCFPIREILAANRDRDIAIARIDARGLPVLPLSIREPVGRPVCIIAHPSGDLYTFTQGNISRYMRKSVENNTQPVDWMCVTADFAVGSSGGPVLNRQGAVVGMVARTHTISADPHSRSPSTQMVVKMTIPSEAILGLVEQGRKERR